MDIHKAQIEAMKQLTDKLREIRLQLEDRKPVPAPAVVRREQWHSVSKRN